MDIVRLRTGTEVPDMIAVAFYVNFSLLIENAYLDAFELAMACQDPTSVLPTDLVDKLTRLRLIDGVDADGHIKIRSDYKNVILASCEGEDMEFAFVSPFAPAALPTS